MFLLLCSQQSSLLLKSVLCLCLQYLTWASPFTALLTPVLSFPCFLWAIWQYGLFGVRSICTRGNFCLKINLGIFIYFMVPINKIDSDEILPSTKNLIKKCYVLIQGRKSVLQYDWSHQLLGDRIWRAWNRVRIQIFSVLEITCSEHQKTSLRFQKDDVWFKSLTWKKAIKRLWKISWMFFHPFEFVPQMSKGTLLFSLCIIAVCLVLFAAICFSPYLLTQIQYVRTDGD